MTNFFLDLKEVSSRTIILLFLFRSSYLTVELHFKQMMSFAVELDIELSVFLLSSVRAAVIPQDCFDEHAGILRCGAVPDNGLSLWTELHESATLPAKEDKNATKEKTFASVLWRTL
jgi:hypothetical protein